MRLSYPSDTTVVPLTSFDCELKVPTQGLTFAGSVTNWYAVARTMGKGCGCGEELCDARGCVRNSKDRVGPIQAMAGTRALSLTSEQRPSSRRSAAPRAREQYTPNAAHSFPNASRLVSGTTSWHGRVSREAIAGATRAPQTNSQRFSATHPRPEDSPGSHLTSCSSAQRSRAAGKPLLTSNKPQLVGRRSPSCRLCPLARKSP